MLARIRDGLGGSATIDIEFGCGALGEGCWGAARGLSHFIDITVGTGFGAGMFIDGKVHHGMGHPEMGHITWERVTGDDYAGHCRFHGACVEGMAAGPAIEDRWDTPGADLTERTEVWDLEATYLAQALRTFTDVVAPQRILLGGGVMQHEDLIELRRAKLADQLNGYATIDSPRGPLDDYVVTPAFRQDAGRFGAIALAMRAAGSAQ